MNTAVFMLRAKQMGLSMAELEDIGNDLCEDDYPELATQDDFDSF